MKIGVRAEPLSSLEIGAHVKYSFTIGGETSQSTDTETTYTLVVTLDEVPKDKNTEVNITMDKLNVTYRLHYHISLTGQIVIAIKDKSNKQSYQTFDVNEFLLEVGKPLKNSGSIDINVNKYYNSKVHVDTSRVNQA